MWTTMQSPLFPDEWPPTASTVWVRYTFAYGNNPGRLADGAYVTRPLTRTTVRRDGTNGEVMISGTALESAGIQGVRPLDAASGATLGKGARVQAKSLQLQSMPDEATAAEVRGYYRVWVSLNGVFTALVRSDHEAFLEWVDSAH
jgi:hypothetical protein